MNYTILINQHAAINNFPQLDIVDMAIFDFIRNFYPNAEKQIDDQGIWFWLHHKKIIEDIPLIKLTTRQSVIRRINNLVECNIIERHPDNGSSGGRSFFKPGVNWGVLIFSQGCNANVTGGVTQMLHYNSTIDNSTNSIKEGEKNFKEFSLVVNQIYDYSISFFPEETKPSTEVQVSKWKDTIRKLVENDQKDPKEICQVVRWARNDNFWSDNFLSILKLRKKNKDGVTYYTYFQIKMKKNGNTSTQQRTEINKTGKVYQKSWEELDKD